MCMACSCGFSKGCTSVLTGSGFIAPPCVLCVLSVYFVCTLQFFLIVRINFSEFSDIGIIAKKKKVRAMFYMHTCNFYDTVLDKKH